MNFIVCGINHKTAPVALRERMTIVPEKQDFFLQRLKQDLDCKEAIFLATCNRCELYVVMPSSQRLVEWLCAFHQISFDEFASHLYIHQDAQAILHAIRVSTGIDSMVFGEPQIFGQMKAAVTFAKNLGMLGTQLHTVFQQVFSAVKQVRTQTTIGHETTSIAAVAINLAKLIYEDFSQLNVMLIGAGDTIEQVLKQLMQLGIKNAYAFNRSIERAKKLIGKQQGNAFTLEHIEFYLGQVDIIISATASADFIIDKFLVEKSLSKKRMRPMYFIDLAMPRDIHPDVAKFEGVYLYNLDDLQAVIANNLNKRKEAIKDAEVIINKALSQCVQKLKIKQHHQLIYNYRNAAEEIKQFELNKAIRLLQSGEDPEIIMNKLASNLTGKLTHEPTLIIKQLLTQLN